MAGGGEEVGETALQEVESEEEDETELAYPDTVIQLHHVGGDRYIEITCTVSYSTHVSRFELQRSVSTASSTTLDTRDDTAQQHKVERRTNTLLNTLCTYFLQGDRGHKHMSTKQRRYIAPTVACCVMLVLLC